MPDILRNIHTHPKLIKDFLEPYHSKIAELQSDLELAGLQVGIFHYILKKWHETFRFLLVKHEDLCLQPVKNFQSLYQNLNIPWSMMIENFLNSQNKSGTGYTIERDLTTVNNKWKERLTKNEIEEIKRGYTIFPDQYYQIF
jgi:hypothetical protein